MSEELSWDKFLQNANEIVQTCNNQLGECWEILGNEKVEGGAYVVKKSYCMFNIKDNGSENSDSDVYSDGWISASNDSFKANTGNYLIKFEHHILYNISYRVPVLAFNAWKPTGELITLEEAWAMMNQIEFKIYLQFYTALTQMDHPVLQKPFLTLHPFTTSEFMSMNNFDLASENPLLRWLSYVGPIVHLKIPLELFQLLGKSSFGLFTVCRRV